MRILLLLSALYFCSFSTVLSQNIHVDPIEGLDTNVGTKDNPYQSISAAIIHANSLTGKGEIRVKLHPGIYTLNDKVAINPLKQLSDTSRFVIEALYNPMDLKWSPKMMPIIISTSLNNSITQFPHSTGFLVASSHVTISGIKFLGNPNPETKYYYPISKEDSNLKDLVVSQCMFLGNKESAPIQGGVWAHGPDNVVENCVFYQCRNGVLFFNNVENFVIKNSIITESYESAFWFGSNNYNFHFSNNVIFKNNHVMVGAKDLNYTSKFENSIIAENGGYTGYWSRTDQAIVKNEKSSVNESEIIYKIDNEIVKNNDLTLAKNHLHLKERLKNTNIKVGIFK